MSKGNQALLVAAIDFGTTYSGYAFSFRHEFEQDPLKVCASSWTTGSRVSISLKTSSTILFKPNRQFDSFGFEAEDKYSDLALDDEHRDWYYFRRFKMMLYSSKDVHRTSLIKDETGKELPAMEVFAAGIRYLKDHMMQSCTERMYGGDMNLHDIRWVLTVPAIWDDAAKQFMREAALKAGIPGEYLKLALEPEAASMFCRYLPVERMMGSADKKITCFQPKSKYLVLDAGGGTVDITVHEVIQNGKLKELYKANGGAWGGTTIDEAFMRFIQAITGEKVILRFQEDHKDDFIDLLREFEIKKRTVKPDMDSKVTFKIPITLHELYRDVNDGEIRDAVRKIPTLEGKVTFAGDKMRVEADTVKALFAQTNDTITKHLQNILSLPVAQGISSILMVGGFSESPMLRHAVETSFPNARVIIPHEAGLAVLKGAVIFGHDSNIITSRIAKFTYGLKCYSEFDPSIHPKERVIYNKCGGKEVRGSFSKLVEVGQSVSEIDQSKMMSYHPTDGESAFCIKLFASPKRDPIFVDEPECISIGEVSVDCRDRHGKIGSASVGLIFGGTELEVRAVHNTTGEETKATFDFLE
ncbi:heat shock 70 kDa protein 12A-like [Ruditapes philippinarum]|uniref:heat shock 70 kDa protein 12A-like n=1 Tax=Ruditapes philippinarum TaxID=129788 RepID=UPI00295ABADB|nr:heat shock 70 kDa protein 12A-like [Ruditapes philippinarum]XP_060570240.1 heat shock 70 kDa protein 12A-like [Ruditapes philippinarum]